MTSPHLAHEALVPVGAETSEDFGEKCGVFGVFAPDTNVALSTYDGLLTLKHRGQDASGQVVATDDGALHLYKQLGNVKEVFENGTALPEVLPTVGRLAIGHNRYGTMMKVPADMRWHAAQPILGEAAQFAGAYNGDVSNIHDVMTEHGFRRDEYISDTEGVMKLVDLYMAAQETPDIMGALEQVLPRLSGAFSAVFTDGQRLIGARDRNGFRPFVYGQTAEGGHVLASEVRALHEVRADFVREIRPGEIVAIDENGLQSSEFAASSPTPCFYEFAYFSKEDNILDGQKVGDVRWRFGRELAAEHPVLDADMVVGVPNSGIVAAEAYAKTLNLPYEQVILKHHKSNLRSFLANTQTERESIAANKFEYETEVIAGKKMVVIDDSVIRGTVSRILIEQLRAAGAAEVHVRVPAPEYRYSCHYGMDTGRPEELLATNRTLDEMRDFIGADSLEFLSPAGVTRAAALPFGKMCLACATGEYPSALSVNLIK